MYCGKGESSALVLSYHVTMLKLTSLTERRGEATRGPLVQAS